MAGQMAGQMHVRVVVILALAAALVQPAVAVKVGEGTLPLKVDSEVIATNKHNTAIGVFRLTNNGEEPVTIGQILYDIRFAEDGPLGPGNKDDIRQQYTVTKCGSEKLPLELKPGAKLDCPFTSRENIYKGPISIVAVAADANATSAEVQWPMTEDYTAFATLDLPSAKSASTG